MDTKSKELFEEAKRHIPGGVNSPVRAFGAVGLEPVIVESAQGPYITDIERCIRRRGLLLLPVEAIL